MSVHLLQVVCICNFRACLHVGECSQCPTCSLRCEHVGKLSHVGKCRHMWDKRLHVGKCGQTAPVSIHVGACRCLLITVLISRDKLF